MPKNRKISKHLGRPEMLKHSLSQIKLTENEGPRLLEEPAEPASK